MKNRMKVNFLLVALVAPLLATGCEPFGHTHNFDLEKPIWNWNDDKTEASLKFECTGCGDYSEPVVDSDIETHIGTPTCTEGATTTYTASVEYGGKTYSDTKTEGVGALGHNFTSITVSGVNNDGYDALTAVTGLTVTKVCSNGHSVVADSSEVVIDYVGNDNVLHYGDTGITVRIKNTNLSKDVALTVKKISVTKPTADTTEFVYNQNEQEYTVVDNNYYSVTGNKKTNAGTSQVTVSLNNKTDFEWAGGGTDDITFDFVISKATPKITGMKDSYTLDCHDALDISDISTDLGSLEVKLYDSNEKVVDDLTALKGGTYTLKASVAGDNINGAEVSSIVEVTHTYDLEKPIWNWNSDKTKASLKFECTGCGDYSEPVTDDDIKTVPGTPTCTEGATTTYEASVEYGGETYTDTKTEDVDPLGHNFTSITVSGVNNDGYDALTAVTGLTVTKVCSNGHSVVADSSEVVIDYAGNDNVLHYGDTGITVRIKNTNLSEHVDLTVKKISVTKPTADTTEFVYNQNEQEYTVAANNCYTVTGNKKTNAGTTSVTVSLNDKTNYSWEDGTTNDLIFDFVIGKATAEITGMESSYNLKCGSSLNVSGIHTNFGSLTVKLFDSNEQEVSLENIAVGDYTLKAEVEGDNNIIGAVSSAEVIVSHNITWGDAPNPDGADSTIGYIYGTCSGCPNVFTKSMKEDGINSNEGFGYGANGTKCTPSGIKSEFPEYENSERTYYRGWTANVETIDLKLPKVKYEAYEKVTFLLHSNSTTSNFVGLGYENADDLISFGNHGNHLCIALNCEYNETTENVDVMVCTNIGLTTSLTITDGNTVNGLQPLTLKFHGGAWRQMVLDNILLNHECDDYTNITSSIPGISKICSTCYEVVAPKEKDITYSLGDFSNNCFGFEENASLGISNGSGAEVPNALKIGGDQGVATTATIKLPLTNFNYVENIQYSVYCNSNGSYIGENDTNRTKTLSKAYMDILLKKNGNSIDVFIVGTDLIHWIIDDERVFNGTMAPTITATLGAYNYLQFAKIVVNSTQEIDVYTTSMRNEISINNGNLSWNAYSARGNVYNGQYFANLVDVTLPKINFNVISSVLFEGAMKQGSKIGFKDDDYYQTGAGGGTNEYYTVEFIRCEDSTIKGIITVYNECTDDANGKKGHDSTCDVYTRFTTVIGTKEIVINDSNIFNGTTNLSFKFSSTHSWNTTFSVAIAKAVL